MSQLVEVTARLFCVRCADVGLDCSYVVCANTEKSVVDKTTMHMFEYHAIKPEEMTTCMKLKIKENVHTLLLSSDSTNSCAYPIQRYHNEIPLIF
jgi:predicted small metal-binding protein